MSQKKTKIVATLGPASESPEVLEKMIRAGLNVARLNFSHGSHEWHRGIIQTIRGLSEKLHTPVAILADIQGPRIRIQTLSEIQIEAGQEIMVGNPSQGVADIPGDRPFFLLDQEGVLDDIRPGDALLIEDGTIQLKALRREGDFLVVQALNPGLLKNRKGVNLPDTPLRLPILTEKDEADLAFVTREKVDYVGLSFVGTAEDIALAREKMRAAAEDGEIPQVVAKIERKEALKNLDKVIKAADAVMVARGDLGIEMPESEVVILQKDIITRSLRQVKPVIVATQMLKSMTTNPRPTRAEVSDVTNAVIDHADAVMLSEESAAGQYPVEAVAMLREIADKTEASKLDDVYRTLDMDLHTEHATMVRSVYELAKSYQVGAILLTSESGYTARLFSHFRPEARLIVATNNRASWQRMALYWGIDASFFPGHTSGDALIAALMRTAREDGRLQPGEPVVVCHGRHQDSDTHQLIGIRAVA